MHSGIIWDTLSNNSRLLKAGRFTIPLRSLKMCHNVSCWVSKRRDIHIKKASRLSLARFASQLRSLANSARAILWAFPYLVIATQASRPVLARPIWTRQCKLSIMTVIAMPSMVVALRPTRIPSFTTYTIWNRSHGALRGNHFSCFRRGRDKEGGWIRLKVRHT